MILRLFIFVVTWAFIILVPGAGIAALGYKACKPRFLRWRERKRQLEAAEQRAKYLLQISSDCSRMCSICLGFVDTGTDSYQPPYDWFHADCMAQLLNK